MSLMKKSKGFTLAEVLITLGVIGVVAALTIPTLMNNISDTQLRTQFKKMYAALSQVHSSLISENGGTFVGLSDNYQTLRDLYADKMKTLKRCNIGAVTDICWHADNAIKYLNNGTYNVSNGIQAFVLSDGAFIQPYFDTNFNCLDNNSVGTIYRCGWIRVDVNGFKTPNVVGKDIFLIHILKDRLLPYGTSNDAAAVQAATSCNSGSTGLGCAAYVINNIDY
jgi:prepilin-type N-terminal cleavage/methylation domain-containing protein